MAVYPPDNNECCCIDTCAKKLATKHLGKSLRVVFNIAFFWPHLMTRIDQYRECLDNSFEVENLETKKLIVSRVF